MFSMCWVLGYVEVDTVNAIEIFFPLLKHCWCACISSTKFTTTTSQLGGFFFRPKIENVYKQSVCRYKQSTARNQKILQSHFYKALVKRELKKRYRQPSACLIREGINTRAPSYNQKMRELLKFSSHLESVVLPSHKIRGADVLWRSCFPHSWVGRGGSLCFFFFSFLPQECKLNVC